MKKLWLLTFLLNTDVDTIEVFLQEKGFEVAYITQSDDGMCQIGLTATKKTLLDLKEHPFFCQKFSLVEAPQIDWQEQALLHAPSFKNGLIEIELGSERIFLRPGQAFGDASHPTTKLMLALMQDRAQNRINDQIVFDIGTGSGILAICAAMLGAKLCYGVEIESEAIRLAQENIALNHMQAKVIIAESGKLPKLVPPLLIVINMISSEMRVVLKEYASYFAMPGITILSGLLIKEKREVLKEFEKRGWKLLKEETLEGWVGLVLERP